MKKLIFVLGFLILWQAQGLCGPDNTMNVVPAAVATTTITAADENTRNSEISTKYNAHSHEDLTLTTSNSFLIGSATDSGTNMSLNFGNDATPPQIRWEATGGNFEITKDGTTFYDIGPDLSQTTATTFLFGSDTDSGTNMTLSFGNSADVPAIRWNGTLQDFQFTIDGSTWEYLSADVVIGSFSRDISAVGIQAVTGVGFRPKAVIFIANVDTTVKAGFGFDDGSTGSSMTNIHATTAGAWSVHATRSIYLWESAGNTCVSLVVSFDSDGFTLDWTKVGTPTGSATVNYFALR